MRRFASLSGSLRGIFYMIALGALISANDVAVKWLTQGFPTGQILVIRGLFIMIPVFWLAWRFGGIAALRVRNWRAQFVRAAATAGSATLFVTSVRYLPLADVVAITFAGPLFVTALAGRVLGENVGWRRWLAVLVGFGGMLLIVRPGGEAFRWEALIPIGAATCGAIRDLTTRYVAPTETSVSMLCFSTVLIIGWGLLSLPFGWRMPSAFDVALLATCGLLLGVAQYLTIEAFRHGEAAVVAPFRYTHLIWATAFGYIVFAHLPDRLVIVGAGLVIASGLYIWHRETLRAKERSTTATAIAPSSIPAPAPASADGGSEGNR